MGLTVVTPPTVEPLSPEEVLTHLRLEQDADDKPYVETLIPAARSVVEAQTGRVLITQTLRLTLDQFPCWSGVIRLPRAPVRSVESIKYVDMGGTLQTIDPAQYVMDLVDLTPRIEPAYGAYWPLTQCRIAAVQVEFVAGYGDDATAVPPAIKAAMKLLIGTWYEQRESVVTGTIATKLPDTVDALLGPYRIVEFP